MTAFDPQMKKSTYPNVNIDNSNVYQCDYSYDKQPQYAQYVGDGPYKNQVQVADTSSDASLAFILMIVGFFVPFVHLINVCMYICSKNQKERTYAKISLLFTIIETLFTILFIMAIWRMEAATSDHSNHRE